MSCRKTNYLPWVDGNRISTRCQSETLKPAEEENYHSRLVLELRRYIQLFLQSGYREIFQPKRQVFGGNTFQNILKQCRANSGWRPKPVTVFWCCQPFSGSNLMPVVESWSCSSLKDTIIIIRLHGYVAPLSSVVAVCRWRTTATQTRMSQIPCHRRYDIENRASQSLGKRKSLTFHEMGADIWQSLKRLVKGRLLCHMPSAWLAAAAMLQLGVSDQIKSQRKAHPGWTERQEPLAQTRSRDRSLQKISGSEAMLPCRVKGKNQPWDGTGARKMLFTTNGHR